MQQSPTTSIEQESSSVTISHNVSEIHLNKINKLEKWCRITKRIVQFFRLIKIPSLRSRFIDIISHLPIDQLTFEDLNGYETNKIQEDLLFLDDIKRYHEVFNTFLSFGFVWQDKEFRLAKMKANYIYDHYMSTSDAIAKTNIPTDTIPFVYNRINSPRIYSSLMYFNLFNDAEKFIIVKLLRIYMREGMNCFSIMSQKQSVPIMNRFKGNRITNGSISSFEHLKEMNTDEKSRSNRSNMKLKNTFSSEPQYDEVLIPNWTYSTDLGVVYNPIREKRMKVIKRNFQKKTKDFDPTVHSMIKLSHSIPNATKLLNSTFSKSIKPVLSTTVHPSSKSLSRVNRQHIDNRSVHLTSTDQSLIHHKNQNTSMMSYQQSVQNSNRFPSSHYHRCDTVFDRRQFSQKVFVCKVHSSSVSESYRPRLTSEAPYRMAPEPQSKHCNGMQRLKRACH